MTTRLTYTSGALDAAIDAEFEERLAAARAADPAPHPHVVAGERVAEGPVFERADPAHTDAVASRAHAAGPEIVARAVAAARQARDEWRRTPYEERCRRLRRVAE